ncbi:hypothetical protein BUALT_Bualt02G0043300 [Buddleja alternifolia]|uniref:Uncharacterized protein n=1 Tax=Buddleja alternifolia TaxID=168488 RepID=A0AAV6Y4G8_9LAMI|nr:hypothetical protein BUALT_Bualt02G0043300 [Buddleja alternifolia]
MDMTPFYLICYIFYTIITSLILSLFLAFRRLFAPRASSQIGNVVALYEGTVRHVRRRPAHHSFKFTARYALIDLDLPPHAPPHYLSADEARRATKTNGPVYLLMIPPSVGYERNPIIFYYCYHIEGSTKTLKRCIVEAYGTPSSESVTFVFNPTSDRAPKSEHISPFMALQLWWKNVPFYRHPKHQNPNYRAEAILRDEKIQFCPAFGGIIKEERIDRCFTWKNAKWHWSWC